jgi:rubrerythrin
MSRHENLVKIFEYTLNQEETGKSFFQHSLKRMGMGAAVSAFKRLIKEEDKHILFIRKILDDLRESREIEVPSQKNMALEPTNYFDERARSEFL